MNQIKYYAEVLSNGYIPIPKDVKEKLKIKKGEKLEIILSKEESKSNISVFDLKFDTDSVLKNIKNTFGTLDVDKIIYRNRR